MSRHGGSGNPEEDGHALRLRVFLLSGPDLEVPFLTLHRELDGVDYVLVVLLVLHLRYDEPRHALVPGEGLELGGAGGDRLQAEPGPELPDHRGVELVVRLLAGFPAEGVGRVDLERSVLLRLGSHLHGLVDDVLLVVEVVVGRGRGRGVGGGRREVLVGLRGRPGVALCQAEPGADEDRHLVLVLDDELLLHVPELVDRVRGVPHDSLVEGLVVALPVQLDLVQL